MVFIFKGHSQDLGCGTPSNSPNINYSALRQSLQQSNDGSYCINVKFHIVRRTNGTGGFSPLGLTGIVSNLNDAFNPVNIYVNSVGYDFINNDSLYNSNEADNPESYNQESFTQDAVNIYLVNSLTDSYSRPLSGSAFNILSQSFVVINSKALTSTTPHELGHCLNLYHTHETFFGVEAIPRTGANANCDIAGDFLCDTPADPGLIIQGNYQNINSDCIYTGGNGYSPDTSNYMSYAFTFCRTNFTPGQGQRMRDALAYSSILQNVIGTACAITEIVSEDEFTACYSNTNTTTLSVTNGNPPYNWSVSSNIDIVQNNGHSIEIKANTSAKGLIGEVSCVFGNPPENFTQAIWLNTPFAPASISGPTNVTYDTPINYQCGIAEGAKYYVWFLPHPFDIATEPLYFHPNWWMFENNTRYIQAYTADGSQGDRNGYVQAMGANKCGLGDAKLIWVQQGSGGSGQIRIVAYPNEADNELNVDLSQMPSGTLYVYLYDSTYNLRYYGEQTNDTIKTINTLGLEEGIYFLQVYDGVTVETKQIVINH